MLFCVWCVVGGLNNWWSVVCRQIWVCRFGFIAVTLGWDLLAWLAALIVA